MPGTDTPKALSQALQLKFNKFVVIFFNLPLDKSHYISGFVQKKMAMLQKAKTKGELQEISKPPKPVYNGNGFTPGKYDTEEEEVLLWSLTSLQAPLNDPAYKRYEELFCRLLPEKAKILFPEMDDKNAA